MRWYVRWLLALSMLAVTGTLAAFDGAWSTPPVGGRPPQVGVYLFLWYRPTDAGWGNGSTVVAPDAPRPRLGWYDSADPAILRAHLAEITAAGFDFVIVDVTAGDPALWATAVTLLREAEGFPLKVVVMLDGLHREPAAVQQAWLARARDTFGQHPQAFHLQGKPLLLLFSSFAPVTVAGATVRNVYWSPDYRNGSNPFYKGRTPSRPTYPIDWPFWAPGLPPVINGVTPIIPGYDDRALGRAAPMFHPRGEGDLYRRQWEHALRQGPDIITVYSWNEHFEQTAIEPTDAWGYQYVEITREFIRRAQGEAPLS